ncbi:glutathione S-transferase family protein [Oceanicola sp. 502str15]|uniref:glutathione S-transferase family protein n=1 Tax=Oceanicola sp. 502str15 TaxID=2696061 RepID=UPI002094A077|nr:glutathione S-transferase N-terminal domain-containing protein [Oceanicola sp. 502str15]MCO6385079.1 glutathione S-transferase [Oceanicola sp. 502str15]
MTDLSDFLVTKRWPVEDSSKLQLFSFPTPNGRKIGIALEEMGLPYEAHRVTVSDKDVKSPEFLSLNPNNKIPAIIDPDGPGGEPLALWESGAILIYLAEKTGKFYGAPGTGKHIVNQWLMWQMGGLGPMLGQLGYFVKFAGSEIEDPRPRERFINEAKRLLGVLDGALEGKDWVAGDYSIADMAIVPWLMGLEFYGAEDLVGLPDLRNVTAYIERFKARPAVQAGLNVPPREG